MNESALRQVGPGQVVSLSHMPFAFDGGIARRAAIGLIVLATDQTIEHEFRQIMSDRRRGLLRDADPQCRRDQSHHLGRDGEGAGRGDRPDPARLQARRGGLWLHLGHRGHRRGAGLRPHPRGTPGSRLHHPHHGGHRRAEGARRQAHRAADPLYRGGQSDVPRLHRGARDRGAGHGLLQPRERHRGGAHHRGVHPRGGAPSRGGRPDRRGLRLLHQPAGRCHRRIPGARGGRAGDLEQSCPGLALPAARRLSRAGGRTSAACSGCQARPGSVPVEGQPGDIDGRARGRRSDRRRCGCSPPPWSIPYAPGRYSDRDWPACSGR